MRKRRSPAVSLAGRTAARDRVRPGHEDATPERLRHARENGSARVDGEGVRRLADPFDLLRARGLLDRTDAAVNDLLWQAGDRLRAHWHGASFDGLSAFDFSRPSVDKSGGGAPGALNPGEVALRHRDHYREAARAIGPRLLPYVTAVVIESSPIADLRALVGDTGHPRTAEALAIERLREGLHRLADLWSMNVRTRSAPIRGWREGAAGGRSGPID